MNKWDINYFRVQGGLKTIQPNVPDDLFLVCAGYEERSFAAARSFSPDYRAKVGIIYKNEELFDNHQSRNAEHSLTILSDTLKRHCDQVSEISGSWVDAKKQLLALRSSLIQRSEIGTKRKTITVDTTTFNRESLLVALSILRNTSVKPNLRVVYVSPKQHGDWLSRGFREVRNVMGFAGMHNPSRKSVLMILSGFEPERVLNIIDKHEPYKVLLGIGDPPTKPEFLDRNLIEQKLVFSRQQVEEFRFPVVDFKFCQKILREALSSYINEYNIVIAPMSTKLSTIAAYLLVESQPEIQITCGVPGEYNTENYSSGISAMYMDQI